MANIDERVVKLSMDDSSLQQGVSRVTKALAQLKKAFKFSDTKSFAELDRAAKKVKFDNVAKSASDMQKSINQATNKATNDFAEMGSGAQKSIQQIGTAAGNVPIDDVSRAANKMAVQVQGSASEANSAIGKIGTDTSGLEQTNGALDKLKMAISSFGNNIGNAMSEFHAAPVVAEIDGIGSAFSKLESVGIVAMGNLVAKAVSAGAQIASGLTNGIRDGFSEYELQLNSVQTILANTQKEGTNLTQVNTALDQLNTYADKTIYNFAEMTRNIGTFTAAGVDLQTSVSAIKGIANLAAISGSSSQQASTAMYQLSQALATGTVKLMDWNSVVNAGMGGQVFQDLLIQTSEKLGTGAKQYIAAEGSFRDSLQKGWLTSDVLTQSLDILAMDITDVEKAVQSLVSKGYTEEEARQLVQLAQTAQDAATKVKTFSQLIDTTKEAIGSGLSQSFEILFGDFEESKDLWTGLSDAINGVISADANARNQLLTNGFASGYKQLISEGIVDTQSFQDILTNLGGQDHVSGLIKQYGSFEKSLRAGWLTAGMLKDGVAQLTQKVDGYDDATKQSLGITNEQINQLHALNEGLQNGSISAEEFAKKMSQMSGRENVIQGLKNVFSSLGQIFKAVGEAYRNIFPPATGDQVYSLTQKFKAWSETLKPSAETLDRIKRIASGFFSTISIGIQAVKSFGDMIARAFGSNGAGAMFDGLFSGAAALGDWLTELNANIKQFGIFDAIAQKVGNTIGGFLDKISLGTSSFAGFKTAISDTFSGAFDKIGTALDWVWNKLKDFATWVKDNISAGDILAGLTGGGIFVIGKKISDILDPIKEVIGKLFGKKGDANLFKGYVETFSEALDTLKESVSAFTGSIKAFTLLEIAVAISLLANAIRKMAGLRMPDIAVGLAAMGAMMAMLNRSMKSIAKTVDAFDTKGIIKTGIATIAFAKAINMLAGALQSMGTMDWGSIARGLTAMGGAMVEMAGAMKLLSFSKASISTAVSTVILAKAMQLIVEPLKALGAMDWESIGRGLAAMGGALGEMAVALTVVGKIAGFSSLFAAGSILMVVSGLDDISTALKSLGAMSWDEIGRGLTAMGGALTEVGAVIIAVDKISGFSSLFASGAIAIVIEGLWDLTTSFNAMATNDWASIGRGLVAMGGALGEVAAVIIAVDKISGFSSIFASGAIAIVMNGLYTMAQSFTLLAVNSWDEIGRGLVAMGGALGEIGLVTGALGKIAGMSGLFGAGAIFITIQGLQQLAQAFNSFAQYDWSQVGIGLVAMGGALAEVAGISGAVGKIAGLAGIIGAGTIYVAVQGLQQLATSFQMFASMSWDEIGRGLVAMGGALATVGGMSAALGTIAGLAGIIGAGTILIVVQGLDDLANALMKFGAMDWGTIGRGITAMAGAMGAAGLGAVLNTLSGFGANAIATYAKPLGDLADSVKKWSGVTLPPDLTSNLGSLADGVGKFTFSGWGADAISKIPDPLGRLADAVGKWSSVSVPDGINQQMQDLADGVGSFWGAGWGADSLAKVTGPIGDLGTALKKWTDVTIPDGIGGKLGSLADGVAAFWNTIPGGISLGIIGPQIGDLAAQVEKWNGVAIPSGIGSGLSDIAKGVKALGTTSDSIATAQSAVGSIKTIMTDMGSMNTIDLTGLVSSIQQFVSAINSLSTTATSAPGQFRELNSSISSSMTGISDAFIDSVPSIQSSITTLNTALSTGFVSLQTSLSSSMTSIQTQITLFGSENQLAFASIQLAFSTALLGISTTVTGMATIISVGMSAMSAAVVSGSAAITASLIPLTVTFASIAGIIGVQLGAMASIVQSRMIETASAVNSGSGMIRSALNTLATWLSGFASTWQASFTPIIGATRTGLNLVAQAISSYNGRFSQEGRSLANSLGSGMRSGIGNLSGIFNSALSAAVDGARAYRGSFESAGSYLAAGLAVGISRNSGAVSRAAADAVSNAVTAAKKAGDINSPSRVMAKVGMWFDKGLENGIADNVGGVVRAAEAMMASGIDVIDSSLSNIGKLDIPDFDVNPTITPVMDLSVVEGQAAYLDSLLSNTVGVGYSSKMIDKITAMPRQRDVGRAADTAEKTPQQVINNYDFTQNNTSPKALSRYDIYKQTRTQFRQFEQMNRNGGR